MRDSAYSRGATLGFFLADEAIQFSIVIGLCLSVCLHLLSYELAAAGLALFVAGHILFWKLYSLYWLKRSEKLGLAYFYIQPYHPLVYRLLTGTKLPEARRYFKIHFSGRQMSEGQNGRKALALLARDVEHLKQSWLDETVLVGNTFASLGSRQLEMIGRLAELEVKEGCISPLQSLFISKMKFVRDQRKYFGRVLIPPPDKLKWAIYIIKR